MRRDGLTAVRAIHDNLNLCARASRANLVQYRAAAVVVRLARACGGARGLSSAVSEFDRRRYSTGPENLRDIRAEGCGGNWIACDLRTPRRLQCGDAQGLHP